MDGGGPNMIILPLRSRGGGGGYPDLSGPTTKKTMRVFPYQGNKKKLKLLTWPKIIIYDSV